MRRTRSLLLVFCMVCFQPATGQLKDVEIQENYDKAFEYLKAMLEGKQETSFKKAVFVTENAYEDNQLDYTEFNRRIRILANMSKGYKEANSLVDYDERDRDTVAMYGAIFKIITDTTLYYVKDSLCYHLPYTYDFEDIWGDSDWRKMFVYRLMETRKGNCHSLPYLYKMVAEELGYPAYLALAPNHIYLKHRRIKGGWYNTELTSASFPFDSWLATSGYISFDAIRKRTYLDSLGNKESIALCVTDLAQGYQRKVGKKRTKFVLKCCDLTLKYFPNHVSTLLLKAETLKGRVQNLSQKPSTNPTEIKAKYNEMEKCYTKLYELGYKNMPRDVYVAWLNQLNTQKEKYCNKGF